MIYKICDNISMHWKYEVIVMTNDISFSKFVSHLFIRSKIRETEDWVVTDPLISH